jgi:pyruvate formate-lyase activating enzyme-like uncharacterized protein
MAREIDLDEVMLSQDAAVAWHEMAGRVAVALQHIAKMGKEIPQIPDERARVNDNGTLTIFVNIPGVIDVSMEVPGGHWSYRQ